MFWDRLKSLCDERNIAPTVLARKIGLSANAASKWKKGALPESKTLRLIADFFNVSVDYLIGKTDERKAVVANIDINSNINTMINLFKQLSEGRQCDVINIARTFLISDRKTTSKAEGTNLV